jgi:hypothetical protein
MRQSKYRVIFDDPDNLDEPTRVLIPSTEWISHAMSGRLPPIWVYWQLQDDERKAIEANQHDGFEHDHDKWVLQFTAPRVGPLTEEEAMEYLVMKDLPRRCWAEEHNRPMFKIVLTEQIPSERNFRSAWEIAA